MKSNSKSIRKKPNDSIVIRSTGRSGDCSVKEIQTALNETIFRFTHNKINTAIRSAKITTVLDTRWGNTLAHRRGEGNLAMSVKITNAHTF